MSRLASMQFPGCVVARDGDLQDLDWQSAPWVEPDTSFGQLDRSFAAMVSREPEMFVDPTKTRNGCGSTPLRMSLVWAP